MLIELGNHSPVHLGPDERPKVTTIEIPEFDESFREGPGAQHYGHAPGVLTPQQFRDHQADALDYNQGITHLPDHEALLAITAGWRTRAKGRPLWVKVTPHAQSGLTPAGKAGDLQAFLSEHYECPTAADYFKCSDTPEFPGAQTEADVHKELAYWTRGGAPGEFYQPISLPDAQAVYTVDGRINNNNNDGGDSLTAMGVVQGVGTGSTATTLTGCSGLTVNGLANHRVYVYTTAGNVFVYGNVISNTATVITVDQWYVPATPGGSVGASPGTPWSFVAVDGGLVSSWFCAMGYAAGSITNTDHNIATGGYTEYVQAGGTLNRKVCPVASDVSATARTVTLVPVFTANGTDTLPQTFTVAAFFASMTVAYSQAGGPMKFKTAISPTATLSANGDNVTLTETITGS